MGPVVLGAVQKHLCSCRVGYRRPRRGTSSGLPKVYKSDTVSTFPAKFFGEVAVKTLFIMEKEVVN